MGRKQKIGRMGALTIVACGWCFQAHADQSLPEWGLRLGGGAAVSTDTAGGYGLYSGLPVQIEATYTPAGKAYAFGAGVFPWFLQRNATQQIANLSTGTSTTVQETENAQFFPMVVSGYLRRGLNPDWNFWGGFGVGWVPPTSLSVNGGGNGYSGQEDLGGAWVGRLAVGISWNLAQGINLGAKCKDSASIPPSRADQGLSARPRTLSNGPRCSRSNFSAKWKEAHPPFAWRCSPTAVQ